MKSEKPVDFPKGTFFFCSMFQVSNCWFSVFGYIILSFPWSLRFGHTWGELLAVEEESEAVEGNLQNGPSVDASEIPRKKNTFYLGCFKDTCRSFWWDNQHITGERRISEPSTVPMLGIHDRLSRFLLVDSIGAFGVVVVGELRKSAVPNLGGEGWCASYWGDRLSVGDPAEHFYAYLQVYNYPEMTTVGDSGLGYVSRLFFKET